MTIRNRARQILPVCMLLCCTWTPSLGVEEKPPSFSADELIRQVIDTEVKASNSDHSHWMYRQHHVDPDSDVVQECVDTKDGEICRHLAEWGHQLTPAEQQQEQQRIHNLLSDASQERKAQKARNHDGDEALKMLRMLPDAFCYQYDGEDGQYVRLKFQPNPDFLPPSREARVFHAMAGMVLVEPKAKRLVELRGKLIKDVDFGWGLLGHLYQGGTFHVKRENVGDGHWEMALLDVNIHGKALFFHTINAQQREDTTDYKKVPDNLDLAQGASLLFSPNLQAKASAPGD